MQGITSNCNGWGGQGSWVINQIWQVRLASHKRVNELLCHHQEPLGPSTEKRPGSASHKPFQTSSVCETQDNSRPWRPLEINRRLRKNLDVIKRSPKTTPQIIWSPKSPKCERWRRIGPIVSQRMGCNGLLKGAVCFQWCDLWPIFLSSGEMPRQKVFVWTILWILIAQLVLFPD